MPSCITYTRPAPISDTALVAPGMTHELFEMRGKRILRRWAGTLAEMTETYLAAREAAPCVSCGAGSDDKYCAHEPEDSHVSALGDTWCICGAEYVADAPEHDTTTYGQYVAWGAL